MWYAQTSYQEKVGNGPYDLAQIGCFVTAFSNLLEKFGQSGITPEVLNQFFTSHNVYLSDPADGRGVYDDLGWSSITAYNPEILLSQTGAGSWPSSDFSIVEFYYQSVQNPWINPNGPHDDANKNMVTHFCAVDSVASRTIVDSWDGKVKSPDQYASIYGAPTHWATYVKNQPKVVTKPIVAPAPSTPPAPAPVVTPPAAPLPIPTSTVTYDIITEVPGYTTATRAANHTPVEGDTKITPGAYYVFNTYPNREDLINVTKVLGKSDAWINKADNVEKPAPVVTVTTSSTVTNPVVTTSTPDPVDWKDTYKPFPAPVEYVATHTLTVKDLAGTQLASVLPAGQTVKAYGTVTVDNVDYYRLRTNNDPSFTFWYCVPKIDPATNTPSLLVKPVPLPAPITPTVPKETLIQEVESIFPQLLDDIIPSWFRNKNKQGTRK